MAGTHWQKTPGYLRLFGYGKWRRQMTDKDGIYWTYDEEPAISYIDPNKNIPESAKDRIFKPNAYYWVKTRGDRWFPAKRVGFCWFVAGKRFPLNQEITEIGDEIVCPH